MWPLKARVIASYEDTLSLVDWMAKEEAQKAYTSMQLKIMMFSVLLPCELNFSGSICLLTGFELGTLRRPGLPTTLTAAGKAEALCSDM